MQHRFRKPPENYLASLEEKLIKESLPFSVFLKWSRFAESSQRLTKNTIGVPLTMPRVISRSECSCMPRLSQAGVPWSHGKNGIIWTRFPVRTSPVFFYVGEPSFLSRSSRSSRSSHQSNTVLDDTAVSVFLPGARLEVASHPSILATVGMAAILSQEERKDQSCVIITS